jgi:hypothetical protein
LLKLFFWSLAFFILLLMCNVHWTNLAQDRDTWRSVVRAVMCLLLPWNAGNFLTSRGRG